MSGRPKLDIHDERAYVLDQVACKAGGSHAWSEVLQMLRESETWRESERISDAREVDDPERWERLGLL